MARNVGLGLKHRRKKEVTYQSKDRTYSRSTGSKYNTGDSTLKKSKGVDKGTLL